MPNWCSTYFNFHGSVEEITDFHTKLNEWMNKNFIETGFKEVWLGNLLYGVGLEKTIDVDDDSRIRCRGWVEYIGDIDNLGDEAVFQVDTNTAWAPMIKVWTETIKALKYKTVGFSYMAEESGMELYEIWDPYGDFPDRYYIDYYLEGEDGKNEELIRNLEAIRHTATDEEIVAGLQKILNTKITDLEKLMIEISHYPFKDDDSYIYVYKYYLRENLEEY